MHSYRNGIYALRNLYNLHNVPAQINIDYTVAHAPAACKKLVIVFCCSTKAFSNAAIRCRSCWACCSNMTFIEARMPPTSTNFSDIARTRGCQCARCCLHLQSRIINSRHRFQHHRCTPLSTIDLLLMKILSIVGNQPRHSPA